MAYDLPLQLVRMVAERRVIPFVGAGFSAGLDLPGWEDLLRKIAADIDPNLDFDGISEACRGDYLQIAEYLHIKADRRIGHLRHPIETALLAAGDLEQSTPHVELVNLGAPVIYTTNYDDLLEKTFRQLDVPHEVIALPVHLARSSGRKTQIVKYHGDLRHDDTLVLTESSYYERLDLESAMDIKFRSDLLGRSVLFIGYSFRDINIRIIWHKLMRMMKELSDRDRPASYIVRFEPNDVLDTLYDAVGIRTIVLDPEGTAATPEDRTRLLGQFMSDLVQAAVETGLQPNQDHPLFVSGGVLAEARREIALISPRRPRVPLQREKGGSVRLNRLLAMIYERKIPRGLRSDFDDLVGEVTRLMPREGELCWRLAEKYLREFGISANASRCIISALVRASTRSVLTAGEVRWELVWGVKLRPAFVAAFIDTLEEEFKYHEDDAPDEDLAYAVDVAKRMLDGEIADKVEDSAREKAERVLAAAAERYPSIALHVPEKGARPDVDAILEEIRQAMSDAGRDAATEVLIEPGEVPF